MDLVGLLVSIPERDSGKFRAEEHSAAEASNLCFNP